MTRPLTSPHLTRELIARWWSRNLTAGEVVAVNEHVTSCVECRGALTMAYQVDAVADAIDRQLDPELATPTHLSGDQLVGWVDGALDPVERELVASHLAVCEACDAEVKDLAGFAATLTTRSSWRPWGAAAAVLTVALGAGWLLYREREPAAPALSQATVSPPVASIAPVTAVSPALELRDGPLLVERGGAVSGADPFWSAAVKAALQRPELEVPSFALALVPGMEGQRAPVDAGPEVQLLSPHSRVVLDERPLFEWEGPGEESYRVEVFDERFSRVAASPLLEVRAWRPTAALPRGEQLIWKVILVRGAREVSYPRPPQPPAVFAIASAAMQREVEAARATGSHLIAGLAFWRAGLAEEAARELAALREENPASEIARQLADSSARGAARLVAPSQ